MHDALVALGRWLAATPLSPAARSVLMSEIWVSPAIQSLHIVSVAVIMGAAGAINLNILGVVARDQAPAAVIRRLSPFIWIALAVLLVTGGMFVLNRPARYLLNWSFQMKVALILLSCAITFAYQWSARRDPTGFLRPRPAVKAMAAAALVIWVGVTFGGRWMAYAL
jgi:hypothetical protein